MVISSLVTSAWAVAVVRAMVRAVAMRASGRMVISPELGGGWMIWVGLARGWGEVCSFAVGRVLGKRNLVVKIIRSRRDWNWAPDQGSGFWRHVGEHPDHGRTPTPVDHEALQSYGQ